MNVRAHPDHGLFDGGPPRGLQALLRLARPRNRKALRRAAVAVAVLIGWAPLAALSSLNSGGWWAFLSDIGVHARSLVAAPLFIVADALCAQRLGAIARHFLDAGLVVDKDQARFDDAAASTLRLRDAISV
jgi:hypothetical protein